MDGIHRCERYVAFWNLESGQSNAAEFYPRCRRKRDECLDKSARPPQAPNAQIKWDDYIFKFDQSGLMAQVFDGNKVVGMILTMNGEQRIIPLPGPGADKLQKSFDDWKISEPAVTRKTIRQ